MSPLWKGLLMLFQNILNTMPYLESLFYLDIRYQTKKITQISKSHFLAVFRKKVLQTMYEEVQYQLALSLCIKINPNSKFLAQFLSLHHFVICGASKNSG